MGLLEDIFYIDGLYANPYEIKEIFESADEKEKDVVVKEIREKGFDLNPMILAKLKQYEQNQAISK